jgi:hydroxymethylpyrimidine pyrophosphatase-like HAD family hydrolase
MPLRYRLLAIDIDGTLVNSNDDLTAATRDALRRASAAGIHIVLATGRRYSHTLHLVEPLGISVPLITASGALVKDPADHRTLYKTVFEQPLLGKILAVINQAGYDPLLNGDTFSEGFDFYQPAQIRDNRYLAEYIALNPGCGRIWPEFFASAPPGIFAGFVMGTRDEMLAIEGCLHSALPGQVTTNVLRSPRYRGFMCELAPAGVSKWSALRQLAAEWGILDAEICAVGDDVNDIPMIRSAGLGVAMGNALPEVKAAASRIAPTHDHDGLVEVVSWLLE